MIEQGESNPALSLATRAGKMVLSSPLGITRCVPPEKKIEFIDRDYDYKHAKEKILAIFSHLDLTLNL